MQKANSIYRIFIMQYSLFIKEYTGTLYCIQRNIFAPFACVVSMQI